MTATALIVLSVIALFLGGSRICISTVFQTLLLCVLCEGIRTVTANLELYNIFLELLLKYGCIIGLTVIFAYLFQWIENLSLFILLPMAVVILFFCCWIEMDKTKNDIKEINEIL